MGYIKGAGSTVMLNRPNTMTYGVTMQEQHNRTCKTCGKAKPLDDYYKEIRGGHKRHCKACDGARQRAYRQANPEKASKRWSAKNPEKRLAQRLAQRAVLRGDLVRQPCEVCSEPKTHGHHDDYSKPMSHYDKIDGQLEREIQIIEQDYREGHISKCARDTMIQDLEAEARHEYRDHTEGWGEDHRGRW